MVTRRNVSIFCSSGWFGVPLEPHHHIKVHSFSPDVSFLMTFKCVYLWALAGVTVQPTMGNTKHLIQTSPPSQFTHRTVHFIKIYTKDEGQKQREVCLADSWPEETLLNFLLTACQWCFWDQQDFHQMVIRIFFFWETVLFCFSLFNKQFFQI